MGGIAIGPFLAVGRCAPKSLAASSDTHGEQGQPPSADRRKGAIVSDPAPSSPPVIWRRNQEGANRANGEYIHIYLYIIFIYTLYIHIYIYIDIYIYIIR